MNRRKFLSLLIAVPICAAIIKDRETKRLVSSMSFKDWLKTRSANTQNYIMGADRAERFRLNPDAIEFKFPTYSKVRIRLDQLKDRR